MQNKSDVLCINIDLFHVYMYAFTVTLDVFQVLADKYIPTLTYHILLGSFQDNKVRVKESGMINRSFGEEVYVLGV